MALEDQAPLDLVLDVANLCLDVASKILVLDARDQFFEVGQWFPLGLIGYAECRISAVGWTDRVVSRPLVPNPRPGFPPARRRR